MVDRDATCFWDCILPENHEGPCLANMHTAMKLELLEAQYDRACLRNGLQPHPDPKDASTGQPGGKKGHS